MKETNSKGMHPVAVAAIAGVGAFAVFGAVGGALYEIANYATVPLRGVQCGPLPEKTKHMKIGDQVIGLESDVQNEQPGDPWILIFTPNGADSVTMFNTYSKTFTDFKLNVAIFDFPGTGLRWEEANHNQRPSDEQVEHDVRANFDAWLVKHPRANFVIFGTSLGSFSATALAHYVSQGHTRLITNKQCKGLVLAMPIHSLSRATRNMSGVGQVLLRAKLETFEQAKGVKGIPVRVFAGINDGFTTVSDLRELQVSFPEQSQVMVYVFKGKGHNIFLNDPPEVFAQLRLLFRS